MKKQKNKKFKVMDLDQFLDMFKGSYENKPEEKASWEDFGLFKKDAEKPNENEKNYPDNYEIN